MSRCVIGMTIRVYACLNQHSIRYKFSHINKNIVMGSFYRLGDTRIRNTVGFITYNHMPYLWNNVTARCKEDVCFNCRFEIRYASIVSSRTSLSKVFKELSDEYKLWASRGAAVANLSRVIVIKLHWTRRPQARTGWTVYSNWNLYIIVHYKSLIPAFLINM